MAAPVETKVVAAATGAGGGAITADFVNYLIGTNIYHGSVPTAVSVFVLAACTGGLAYLSGWLAPHAHRAVTPVALEPAPVAPAVPPVA